MKEQYEGKDLNVENEKDCGNEMNCVNKYIVFFGQERCKQLIIDLIRDCDTSAMNLWKTQEDFTVEEIGQLKQLKSMRSYLCQIERQISNSMAYMDLSTKEIEQVKEYINKFDIIEINHD